MSSEELEAILDSAPILFGLVQQGHIPTIERMLGEGSGWEEIAARIGWMPEAAEAHYGAYVKRLAPYNDAGRK